MGKHQPLVSQKSDLARSLKKAYEASKRLAKVAKARKERITLANKIKEVKVPSRDITFLHPPAASPPRGPLLTPITSHLHRPIVTKIVDDSAHSIRPDDIPRTVILDRKGDFTPIDTENVKYDRDSFALRSPNIETIQIEKPKKRVPYPSNFPVSKYHAQLNSTGELGIHRPSRVGQSGLFKQPYIVRDIGNEWGIDKINPKSIEFKNTIRDMDTGN